MIKLDFGPTQKMITEELIEDMIGWVPRRFRLCDFDKPLKSPKELGDWQEDWNLRFPFQETFVPSFEQMCPFVNHIPFMSKATAYYTFLKNVSEDKTEAVRTMTARSGSKEVRLEDKLSTVRSTIEVDSAAIQDEIVLLVDDLYQSGVTMNYVAMLLLEAGAKKVFGLSCEKTCSNDDNVSRR